MIKVTNSIQEQHEISIPVDFRRFSNQRLLPFKEFTFAPVKSLNFNFCLRLEFLLNIYLKHFLDDKLIKFYTDFLRRENNKIIYSVLKEKENFKTIVKDFKQNKFTYVKFLTEAFYLLKRSFSMYERLQHYLNKYDLMGYLLTLFNGLRYEFIGGNICVVMNQPWLKKHKNFVDLLELIMLFVYKNRECFFLKVMPATSTIKKSSIVKFIFTLPFQVNFPNVNTFVIKIMEIMLFNINKLADDPGLHKKLYSRFLHQVVSKYNLFGHKNFMKIIEMLIKNREYGIIRDVLEPVEFWPYLEKNINFRRKKRCSITALKIVSFFLESKCYKVESAQLKEVLRRCLRYLHKRDGNILSGCIMKFIKFLRVKKGKEKGSYLDEEGLTMLKNHFKIN